MTRGHYSHLDAYEPSPEIHVAKLNTGQIVRFLAGPLSVLFAEGKQVLVSDPLSENPNRVHPRWVPISCVVGVLKVPKETK